MVIVVVGVVAVVVGFVLPSSAVALMTLCCSMDRNNGSSSRHTDIALSSTKSGLGPGLIVGGGAGLVL